MVSVIFQHSNICEVFTLESALPNEKLNNLYQIHSIFSNVLMYTDEMLKRLFEHHLQGRMRSHVKICEECNSDSMNTDGSYQERRWWESKYLFDIMIGVKNCQ